MWWVETGCARIAVWLSGHRGICWGLRFRSVDEDLFVADDVKAGGEVGGGPVGGYVMAQEDALHVVDIDGAVGDVGIDGLNAGRVVGFDDCHRILWEAELYRVDCSRLEWFGNPRVFGAAAESGVGHPLGEGGRLSLF